MSKTDTDPWWTARLLYQTSANQVKPTWDQIGDVTKQVWYDMDVLKLAGHPRWWSINPGTAAVLRHPPTILEILKMNAPQLTAIASALEDLANAFRAAGGDDPDSGVDAASAKPAVRAGSKAKVAAGKKPAADEVDIDTVREKMKELVAARDSDALLAAFASVGAGKLADVDESQYQGLIDAAQAMIDEEPEEKPAPKSKAKPAAKKAKGPTLDDVTTAAQALIAADKPAYVKLMKKLGKPSDMDDGDYAAAIAAYESAMPEVEDDLL